MPKQPKQPTDGELKRKARRAAEAAQRQRDWYLSGGDYRDSQREALRLIERVIFDWPKGN